ncbi:MAG: hypothetical protein H7138_04980 [Myxococcales bacterium]|nr:hypothetical protein [Myxococcales bacterium]
MGWADGHIARLAQGETVSFRPRGHSMTGKISSGELSICCAHDQDMRRTDHGKTGAPRNVRGW